MPSSKLRSSVKDAEWLTEVHEAKDYREQKTVRRCRAVKLHSSIKNAEWLTLLCYSVRNLGSLLQSLSVHNDGRDIESSSLNDRSQDQDSPNAIIGQTAENGGPNVLNPIGNPTWHS